MELLCSSCGRPIENIGKVNKNPDIKYCSVFCSREKLDKKDQKLELYILDRLSELESTNICPSQISKEYFKDSWKTHHQRVVKAARRLAIQGQLSILQKGKDIKNLNFKGPIRLKHKSVRN